MIDVREKLAPGGALAARTRVGTEKSSRRPIGAGQRFSVALLGSCSPDVRLPVTRPGAAGLRGAALSVLGPVHQAPRSRASSHHWLEPGRGNPGVTHGAVVLRGPGQRARRRQEAGGEWGERKEITRANAQHLLTRRTALLDGRWDEAMERVRQNQAIRNSP